MDRPNCARLVHERSVATRCQPRLRRGDRPRANQSGVLHHPGGQSMTTLDTLLEEIRTGPSGPQIAAFFDFDGTLIDGYSAAALYSHRLRNFEIGPAEAAHTVLATLRGPLSEDQFAELVERGIRGWAGRADDDLTELGERLFVQGIAATLFHDAWRLIKAHQRRGHTVVIATSATRFQAGPLARRLGVEHLLCTELETEDGILTGRLAGRTLWGPGKLAAVRTFAAGHGIDLAASHGYANGDEDVPFLQAVGHPHPVNPQKRLAKEASALGWPVLHFKRRSRRLDPAPALRTAAMYGSLLGASGTATGGAASTWPPPCSGTWPAPSATSGSTPSDSSTCGHTVPRCSSSTTRAR